MWRSESMRTVRRMSGAESGNAMVVALLVLMILTAAGVAYVAITKSEKQISGNEMRTTQAFYAAEGGLTEGLHRMTVNDTANYIGQTGDPTPGWGRYIVMQNGASTLDPDGAGLEHDGLDNNGDGNVDEPGERYPEVPTKQTGLNKLAYPYVRVEYKTQGGQLVRFGDSDKNPATPMTENFTYGAPVLRITARGTKGNSNKVVEGEAVRFPIVDVLGAMWAGGPMAFKGNAFIIDGHDHQAMSPHDTIPGAKPMPGILSQGPTSDIQLAGFQTDNVMGAGDAGGAASVTQSPITYDFNKIWNTLAPLAENGFSGDQTWGTATPTYGTYADPQVTLVKGNLSINGGWSGAGIMMVQGDLAMGGGSTFTGIVIATGNVKLTGGGYADDARIVGSIIFQGDLSGSMQGGAGRIWYSSQAVNNALTLANYTLSRWRER
jgi:hypothetical protein